MYPKRYIKSKWRFDDSERPLPQRLAARHRPERPVPVGPAVDRGGLCAGAGAQRSGGAGSGRADRGDRRGDEEVTQQCSQAAIVSPGDRRLHTC